MKNKKLIKENIKFDLLMTSKDKVKELFFTDWSLKILFTVNIKPIRNKDLKLKLAPICDGTLGIRLNMLEENGLIERVKIELNGSIEIIRITAKGRKTLKDFVRFMKNFETRSK